MSTRQRHLCWRYFACDHALVAADSDFAVDVFTTRDDAESALAEVLVDEPAFTSLLSVVDLDEPPFGAISLN